MYLPHLFGKKKEEPKLTNPEWCTEAELCASVRDNLVHSRIDCVFCGRYMDEEDTSEKSSVMVIELGDPWDMTPTRLQDLLNSKRPGGYDLAGIKVLKSEKKEYSYCSNFMMVAIYQLR